MTWTQDDWNAEHEARHQQPRTGWSALLYAAVRWPGSWFTVRRVLWLGGIVISGIVIVGAGSHVGPGLRAAHGQGIQGQWTAQEYQGSQWHGEFVSSSGTVTLPHVTYAGGLSAVQAGTTVPALDTGAGNEVYPLTGSNQWVHDVIGVVVGTLALIGLLARGLFVARRRGRARRADGFTQGMIPERAFTRGILPERKGVLRRAGPRSRPGQLAVLAVAVAAMGLVSAKLITLLADARPYTGWYWLLAVASGIVIAVALPWALIRAARGPARWPGRLLIGYSVALVVGMRYCLTLRFTPPSGGGPVAPPSTWFVLETAGLSAVALTAAAITFLILVGMAGVIAPGPVGGRLRDLRERRAAANRHSGPVDERFSVRLRPEGAGVPAGPWLRGEIRVRPGSLLWEPAADVYAVPVELARATIVAEDAGPDAAKGQTVLVDTPAGRMGLECAAALLAVLQHAAADLARSSHAQTTSAEAPAPPTDWA